MNDTLQLILNGLVQAIVQHPSFQETLRSILADVQPVPEAIDEELSMQRCSIMTQRGDIDNLISRIAALEDQLEREGSTSLYQLERRVADLERFDMDEAIKECQIDASNIVGLDAAISDMLDKVKITLTVDDFE